MFWREQADLDVYEAVSERMIDPRWTIPRVDISPDGRSRFYSPFDPDYQPFPLDDPAANAYLAEVDGWEGYKCWHRFGIAMSVENPQWLAQFGLETGLIDPETGEYVETPPALEELTLAELVELSLIHSREYQTQLEDLYLAALAVTFERFRFGVRYLGIGGGEPFINETITVLPHRDGDNLAQTTLFGVSQLLPTGAQWAVELTNNTLWFFSGGQTSSASVLSFSLVQPLIMGAGRKIVLENLTQAERQLLYQVRDLARFRQQFFTDVVGATGGGYLGLLLQLQGIRNQQGNIKRLQQQLVELREVTSQRSERFRETLAELPAPLAPADPQAEANFPQVLDGQLSYNAQQQILMWIGEMTPEQEEALLTLSDDPAFAQAARNIVRQIRTTVTVLTVLQLESRLASSINALRDQERNFQDSLDAYKLELGLPTDLPMSIDDELLEPFAFIDPRIQNLEDEVRSFVAVWSRLALENPTDEAALLEALQDLERLVQLVDEEGFQLITADDERLEEVLPERLKLLTSESERERIERDLERDRRIFSFAREEFERARNEAEQLTQLVTEGMLPEDELVPIWREVKRLQEDLLRIARNLQVIQIGLRVEMITIPDFDLSLEDVTMIALENRVDLMNVQARVVDAYRDVEVAANALQTPVNVVVEGDIATPGNNRPFDFRADQSTLRAGVRITAPIDQIVERNAYRTAQIEYDRQRRAYMEFEDNVKLQVRRAWRQLAVLRENIETSRQGVRIAAMQLDLAIEESSAPQQGAAQGDVASSGAQGVNLLNALDSVLNAQNSLIADWINYERARLNIYRDMGIMEVGPDGLWNDPIYRESAHGTGTIEFRGQIPAEAGVARLADPGDGNRPGDQSAVGQRASGRVGEEELRSSGDSHRSAGPVSDQHR
ncbi:Outer membrane efflux protein [Maioricimonas rarisocia]|uniref:Outer membrane efflux protein n=1 Tax=Maioricimonas rarisocia TaxID=2528026 RepID=A0A517ZFG4_9PLAN|nr:TolC family protein [Maioricimonas rarisocia]QDU41216.1 Outer membrane efflux protein [Maioricimonas rarisocia]